MAVDRKIFENARCGGPEEFGLWTFRSDNLESKPRPFAWSCWQPSSGGLRYGKMDFVPPPLDYLGGVPVASFTGEFTHVSMAFDPNGWPVFATNLGNTGIRLDTHSNATSTVEYQWEGTNCSVFDNFIVEPDVTNTDVIAYYVKTGLDDRNIYSRFSREDYGVERSLIEFPRKITDTLRIEVESGLSPVLYAKTDRNREIKIYFEQYPEFPYFTPQVDAASGDIDFSSGEIFPRFISGTGTDVTGAFIHFDFVSGEYKTIFVSGDFQGDTGRIGSGISSFNFNTGEYNERILIRSGDGTGEISGINSLLTLSGGSYETGAFLESGINPDIVSGNLGVFSGEHTLSLFEKSGIELSSGISSFDFFTGYYGIE